MCAMGEKPQPEPTPDDRRTPTDWEDIVGKNIVTPGDAQQIREAKAAMQQLNPSKSDPVQASPADAARAALREAVLKKESSAPQRRPQSQNPAHRLSRDTIARGKKSVQEARDALREAQTDNLPGSTTHDIEE